MDAHLLLSALLPTLVGTAALAALLAAGVRRPSRLLLSFAAFQFLAVLGIAAPLADPWLRRYAAGFSLQDLWVLGLAAGRLRYVFLALFAAAVHRFKWTPALTALVAALAAAGAAAPFFVYSLLPNLAEAIALAYAFAHWLAAYRLRGRIGLSPSRTALLRTLLACSGVFVIGIGLDLLKAAPQLSVYVSILLVDFYPWYLACLGAAVAVWAWRDLGGAFRPAAPGPGPAPDLGTGPGPAAGLDLAAWPLTAREREVVALALEGATNAAVAERLFIAESTVKKHLNNAFRKLGVGSRWELLGLSLLRPKE
jgi:DNA-binding CsgD family transcriptional regulator